MNMVKELRKKIKDAEAQKIMLQMLISEYDDKARTLRNMTWTPNMVPGTNELHFNKWKHFSIAANKKALNELHRQAIETQKYLKSLQRQLTVRTNVK
jgi:hypothetical protein